MTRTRLLIDYNGRKIRTFCEIKSDEHGIRINPIAYITLEDCFEVLSEILDIKSWRDVLKNILENQSKYPIDAKVKQIIFEGSEVHTTNHEGIQDIYGYLDSYTKPENLDLYKDFGKWLQDGFIYFNLMRKPVLACAMQALPDIEQRIIETITKHPEEDVFKDKSIRKLIEKEYELKTLIAQEMILRKVCNEMAAVYKNLMGRQPTSNKNSPYTYNLVVFEYVKPKIERCLKEPQWVTASLDSSKKNTGTYEKIINIKKDEIIAALKRRVAIRDLINNIWDVKESSFEYKILEQIVIYIDKNYNENISGNG